MSTDMSARDDTYSSDVEGRIQHVDQSLRREIARQSELVQKAAVEALDVQVGALREEFMALREGVANFVSGSVSSRGDPRSKAEDTPTKRTFAGDSPIPRLFFAGDSPIPRLPSDSGLEVAPCDEAPFDEDFDVSTATERDLDLLESRVRAEIGSHTERTKMVANALEEKHSKALADIEATLVEFQSAQKQLRSDHAEIFETLRTDFKVELESALAQVDAAQKDSRDSQNQAYDLRFNKVAADQLEGREHLEKSVAKCRLEMKALGERLDKQISEIEAKAIEGFPRKCAEHRESHFKALESILREEFDSKRSRLEASMRSAVEASERKLREGLRAEARAGCPDAGG